MASASPAILSAANACTFSAFRPHKHWRRTQMLHPHFRTRASADDEDCNEEECAPDKEVGKLSGDWLAGDKTKVAGTYPPRKKGWTGYVEKDTAGQTNIYSVEPAVYVAESAISSGTAGTSADGSENTAAIIGGLALISVAAASSILLQVGKNPPQMQTVEYSGPALSYYIDKFQPASAEIVPTSVSESSPNVGSSVEQVSPSAQVELETQLVDEPSSSKSS